MWGFHRSWVYFRRTEISRRKFRIWCQLYRRKHYLYNWIRAKFPQTIFGRKFSCIKKSKRKILEKTPCLENISAHGLTQENRIVVKPNLRSQNLGATKPAIQFAFRRRNAPSKCNQGLGKSEGRRQETVRRNKLQVLIS